MSKPMVQKIVQNERISGVVALLLHLFCLLLPGMILFWMTALVAFMAGLVWFQSSRFSAAVLVCALLPTLVLVLKYSSESFAYISLMIASVILLAYVIATVLKSMRSFSVAWLIVLIAAVFSAVLFGCLYFFPEVNVQLKKITAQVTQHLFQNSDDIEKLNILPSLLLGALLSQIQMSLLLGLGIGLIWGDSLKGKSCIRERVMNYRAHWLYVTFFAGYIAVCSWSHSGQVFADLPVLIGPFLLAGLSLVFWKGWILKMYRAVLWSVLLSMLLFAYLPKIALLGMAFQCFIFFALLVSGVFDSCFHFRRRSLQRNRKASEL